MKNSRERESTEKKKLCADFSSSFFMFFFGSPHATTEQGSNGAAGLHTNRAGLHVSVCVCVCLYVCVCGRIQITNAKLIYSYVLAIDWMEFYVWMNKKMLR